MAKDSIIARPINSVRVIVFSDSGCLAKASNALEIALPIAKAGIIVPSAIAIQATTVETILNKLSHQTSLHAH